MSKLELLCIHCTATPENRPVSKKEIVHWHTVGYGWSRPGYADMVHLDGRIENVHPYDNDDQLTWDEMTWGARGYNNRTRHVVYVGGVAATFQDGWKPKDTRTKAQKLSLENYIKMQLQFFPHLKFFGHNQVAAKACPSFDVPTFLRKIGIAEKNIMQ